MDWWEEAVVLQILESGHGTFGGCFYWKQDPSKPLSQQEREPAELFSVAVRSCDPPTTSQCTHMHFQRTGERVCVCVHM